jgi:hypothetical protein
MAANLDAGQQERPEVIGLVMTSLLVGSNCNFFQSWFCNAPEG